MAAPNVRPSLMWCLLGLPFLVAGFAGFIYFLVDGLSRTADSLTQLEAPGSHDFTLTGGETYTVFLEARTVFQGRVYEVTESIEGLACTVTSDDGTNIPVRTSGASLSYEFPGRSGRSVLAFLIPRDGQYNLTCGYGPSTGPRVVLAVGSGFGSRVGGTVVKALAAGFTGALLGIGVVVAVVIARARAMKRVAAPAV